MYVRGRFPEAKRKLSEAAHETIREPSSALGDALDGSGATKTCSSCGETKPLSGFSRGKNYRDGYRGQCKACVYDYEKKRQQKPEYKEKYRQWVARREEERQRVVRQKKEAAAPKLSPEEFENVLQAHNYRCDICGVKHAIEGETKHFHLIPDHNYRTGVQRGLLCSTCYSAMCFFGDDLEGINRVVDYLKQYES